MKNIDTVLKGEFGSKFSISSYERITWRQGEILAYIVSVVKPYKILELGTSEGFSLLWLLKGNLESQIVTVDIDTQKISKAKGCVEAVGESRRVSFYEGHVYDILESLDNLYFDFVFVDVLQKEYSKLLEILQNKNLLLNGAVLVFDNLYTHNSSDLLKYCDSLGLEYYEIDEGSGFLVVFFSV